MAFFDTGRHCPGFLFFVALGAFVGRCDGGCPYGQGQESGLGHFSIENIRNF